MLDKGASVQALGGGFAPAQGGDRKTTSAAAGPETKRGPHRSANPQGFPTMKHTKVAQIGQVHSAIADGPVRLTPASAGRILREHGYERNRKIEKSPAHVSTLAEIMRRGEWLPRTQIAFGRFPDGRTVLINGHHRMAAQAQSGTDVLWDFIVYNINDEQELQALYTRFDTNAKTRTESNILASYGVAEQYGLSAKTAQGLYRSAPIIANGLRAVRAGSRGGSENFVIRIAEDRMEVMQGYAHEAVIYDRAIKNATPTTFKSRLQSGAVMAVALVTLRADEDRAVEFWTGIADNDGLRRGDPRATLRQWLIDNSSRGDAQPPIVAATRAWNYWCVGNDLKIIKITGNGMNVTGTTYWVTP